MLPLSGKTEPWREGLNSLCETLAKHVKAKQSKAIPVCRNGSKTQLCAVCGSELNKSRKEAQFKGGSSPRRMRFLREWSTSAAADSL